MTREKKQCKRIPMSLGVLAFGSSLLLSCTAHYNISEFKSKSMPHKDFIECLQKSTTIPVDPAIVRRLIPPEYELYIQADG